MYSHLVIRPKKNSIQTLQTVPEMSQNERCSFPGTILEPDMLIFVYGRLCSTILTGWHSGTPVFLGGWMYYQNRVAGTKRSRCPSSRSTSNRHGVVKARSRKEDTWNSLIRWVFQRLLQGVFFGGICHVIDGDVATIIMLDLTLVYMCILYINKKYVYIYISILYM